MVNSRAWLLISAFLAASLFGCVKTPVMDANASRQVFASTPKSEGNVAFFTVGQWMPNTKEFRFANEAQTPKIPGVVVVTDESVLFQQWGGPTGLTIIKRIPMADIAEASLITFGMSARMIVRSQGNQYDSFAASDISGEISIRKETIEMYEIVSDLLRSKKRESN